MHAHSLDYILLSELIGHIIYFLCKCSYISPTLFECIIVRMVILIKLTIKYSPIYLIFIYIRLK